MHLSLPGKLLVVFSVFSLFVINADGQVPVKKYEKEWKKIEDFVNKGLPKSALTEVKKLYDLAKKEKQDAQVIKTLVSMTGLQTENREDNEVFSIGEIEKEIGNNYVVSELTNYVGTENVNGRNEIVVNKTMQHNNMPPFYTLFYIMKK